MTLTLVPYKPRPTDRAPKAKLHTGPYYGESLRRILTHDDAVESKIDRLTLWYERQSPRMLALLILLIAVCVGCAYLIVEIAR